MPARVRDQINRLLSVELAAPYCGISISYLNKMRGKGGGPAYYKLGRKVLYSINDLDLWLAKHQHTSVQGNDQT